MGGLQIGVWGGSSRELESGLRQLSVVGGAEAGDRVPASLRGPAIAAAPRAGTGGDVVKSAGVLVQERVQEAKARLASLEAGVVDKADDRSGGRGSAAGPRDAAAEGGHAEVGRLGGDVRVRTVAGVVAPLGLAREAALLEVPRHSIRLPRRHRPVVAEPPGAQPDRLLAARLGEPRRRARAAHGGDVGGGGRGGGGELTALAVRAVVPTGVEEGHTTGTALLVLLVQPLEPGQGPGALVLTVAGGEDLRESGVAGAVNGSQPLQERLVLGAVLRVSGVAPELRLDVARHTGDRLDVKHGLHPGAAGGRVTHQLRQALAAGDAAAVLAPVTLEVRLGVVLAQEGGHGLLVVGSLPGGVTHTVQLTEGLRLVLAQEGTADLLDRHLGHSGQVARRPNNVHRLGHLLGEGKTRRGAVHGAARAVGELPVLRGEHTLRLLHGDLGGDEGAGGGHALRFGPVLADEGLNGGQVRRSRRDQLVHLGLGEVLTVHRRLGVGHAHQLLFECGSVTVLNREGQLQLMRGVRTLPDLPRAGDVRCAHQHTLRRRGDGAAQYHGECPHLDQDPSLSFMVPRQKSTET
eukprot:Hpha_TRINITY_DN15871_c1_g16::TRINITY_DN15871_c1_g16_i1::g.187804::m.187804